MPPRVEPALKAALAKYADYPVLRIWQGKYYWTKKDRTEEDEAIALHQFSRALRQSPDPAKVGARIAQALGNRPADVREVLNARIPPRKIDRQDDPDLLFQWLVLHFNNQQLLEEDLEVNDPRSLEDADRAGEAYKGRGGRRASTPLPSRFAEGPPVRPRERGKSISSEGNKTTWLR
jgi:hypothetical protein